MNDTLSQSVSFNGYVSFGDFRTICQNINLSKKPSRVITIMVIAAISLQIWLIKISIFGRVLSLAGAGLIIWLLFFGIEKSMLKQQRKQYEASLNTRRGMISPTGIQVTLDGTNVEADWDSFIGYRILGHLLVLIDKSKGFFGFAPYMFPEKRDWDVFSKLVEGKLQQI